MSSIPAFSNKPYVTVNDNTSYFTVADNTTISFESYSLLDSLGRCGVAYACIGKDIMPTEERGSIGSVKPSGWQTIKYDNIDGKYLYNKCHLIGSQLSGENANTRNLITGTRYMNVEGMLPFENMVADYIKETNNHVLYRVTPTFKDNNMLASGVLIEAKSVEDNGEGILFCVYCYNNQPGITINYAIGDSNINQLSIIQLNRPIFLIQTQRNFIILIALLQRLSKTQINKHIPETGMGNNSRFLPNFHCRCSPFVLLEYLLSMSQTTSK